MQGFNIYQVDTTTGYERHLGTWTDEGVANRIIDRLRERDADDELVEYNLRPVLMDPTADELNLPLTLSEMLHQVLVDSAEHEIHASGEVVMPLWVNPSWLIFELRQRGLHLNRSGRKLVTVEPRDEERRSPEVATVQEAWYGAADEVMDEKRPVEDDDPGFRESL